ncbi:MAG: homoserine kinase [Thermoproteus sp. AZ2]|uniref:Homoserine kinase n=1 Tax=Thermoproteus sp. AZ2 TaxID=1609232 RepID=A0ACC6UYN3_9CREN
MSAPSTSANLGAGFDVVAVAHDAYQAHAYAKVGDGCGVHVKFKGYDPGPDNTVRRAIELLFKKLGVCKDVEVEVDNRVPVGKGLGSSAASSVAAVSAVLAEMGVKVQPLEIAEICGLAEEAAAGSPHFDNSSAAAFGGAVVITGLNPLRVAAFRPRLTFVVAVPETPPMAMKTKVMRDVLPREVPFKTYASQLSRVAALALGLATGDIELLSKGMEDDVVVPARARLVPAYHEAKRAALEAGALGFTISGAGPATIALVDDKNADAVAYAVKSAYEGAGLRAEVKVAHIWPGRSI